MTDSCRQSSLVVSEDLLGSAPANTNYWFLVENRAPFTPKVVKKSGLADTLRPLTDRLAEMIPTSRVQFIRRSGVKDSSAPLKAFIADARQPNAKLWTRSFESHEELLDIAWEDGADSEPPTDFTESTDPLILICTHGKRDACCALHGRAFLKELSESNRTYVWESSHIGGHRFAATCVTLPFGHYYGRLQATDANLLVDATRRGELFDLRTYRGFAALSLPAQIVEGRLREKTQRLSIPDVLYVGESRDNMHEFIVAGSDHPHLARVVSEMSEAIRVKSCGKEAEPFLRHSVIWTA